jgi:hypothetical protein
VDAGHSSRADAVSKLKKSSPPQRGFRLKPEATLRSSSCLSRSGAVGGELHPSPDAPAQCSTRRSYPPASTLAESPAIAWPTVCDVGRCARPCVLARRSFECSLTFDL